jgi:thiamine-phosphate diphosphorylase
MRDRPPVPRLIVLTDASPPSLHAPEDLARAAWSAGADAVEWRDKSASPALRRAVAERLVALRQDFPGRLLLVNDDPALAARVGADGVHVGPDDPTPRQARARVGAHRLVGFSAGTPEEAAWAEEQGADYLGVGPVYATGSKPDAGGAIGLAGLARVLSATRLPVIAIGGVTAGRVGGIVTQGAHGVAVLSALTRAADPEAATRELAQALARALSARGVAW